MNKVISTPIAIIIIVVLGILIGGIIIWQYLEIPEEGEKISEEKVEEEPPEDETADWNVYRNEEYGFEIKYPANFALHELSDDGILFRIAFWDKDCSLECGSIEISIRDNEEKSFQQIKEEAEDKYSSLFSRDITLEGTTVDDKQAYIQLGYEFRLGGITVVSDKYIYDISRWYSSEDIPEELFNQMLSTFRFID